MDLARLLRHPSFIPLAVQTLIGYQWFMGGYTKIMGGAFTSGLPATLERFASKNPHTWYVESLLAQAQNAPVAFGQLVQWGELLAGIGLVAAVILSSARSTASFQRLASWIAVPTLIGGLFMTANFFFAAGWTTPSTSGLNALLFWTQLALLTFWIPLRHTRHS
jgi:uncharacterized membrane protein YphA (DoxX/SURF4 family)